MKAAFEFGFVFLFGMLFIVLGMSFGSIILTQNQARVTGETILALIEHQNRYDASVAILIEQNPNQCAVCTTAITHDALTNRYHIMVSYPLSIPLLNYQNTAMIHLISRPINR